MNIIINGLFIGSIVVSYICVCFLVWLYHKKQCKSKGAEE